ncbi:Uncharacterised protein [Yersinia enterocolitica]|uniref:Uncharacterized protein n=1 Tax=Yersinia enterocolitica TaxID=630 RepID=A0ABP1YGI9_YEREN|nr:Uncharacterised protein [Yersinia enterocolitica]CNE77306.1 Uncharacterised protein [Yersinia enterocolitica]CNG61707.1 Uncharacterised protein [Yersinia enterocolitica]CRX97729.1 Uncharacterised protein [Yersinia enterocolitica]
MQDYPPVWWGKKVLASVEPDHGGSERYHQRKDQQDE